MAKVVFMERSDQAGAFQKVMRTAETESDSFGASGSGPMHEKLRAAYDSFLRGHPDLDPEQCFALAWNGLSLSDQAQLRSEETGEYQERLAEEARYRESSLRAERRGEGKQTMKHEQVGHFTKGCPRRFCRRRADGSRARGSCRVRCSTITRRDAGATV